MSGMLIRLFLVDGNPNGLRTVELSNMTIYTTAFPRAKLKEFLDRSESKKAGCYILMGNDIERPEVTKIYIGEGEDVGERLKSHAFGDKQKEFWDEVLVFTSKDDYITKTQIQYLESELYRLAKEADKAILDNRNQPSKPNLSEVDNAEMEQFLDVITLIMSSIGIDVLESKKVMEKEENKFKKEKIYTFTIKEAVAKMKIEEDKYIVLKNSTAVIENRPSVGKGIKNMRNKLLESGMLKEDQTRNLYFFTDNYIFTSPSSAASVISGGEENGRIQWKYKGKNLNEIEEEEIK